MSELDTAEGEICLDCTMLEANGETPPNMNEDETRAYLNNVEGHPNARLDMTLGTLHHDPEVCDAVDEAGNWHGEGDCPCETVEFSRSVCDMCGSRLAGYRHRVTFWF